MLEYIDLNEPNKACIDIQQDIYIKHGCEDTLLTAGRECFKMLGINKDIADFKQPQDVGLINDKINLKIPKTKPDLYKDTLKNATNFTKFEEDIELKYPTIEDTFRGLNREIVEKYNEYKFAEDTQRELEEITGKNKEIEEKMEREKDKLKRKGLIDNILKSKQRPNNFLSIKDGEIVYVYAYKFIYGQYGETAVLVYRNEENELDLIWAPTNIKNILLKARELNLHKKLDITESYGTYKIKTPILCLKKTGIYFSKDSNYNTRCAKVEVITAAKNDKELDIDTSDTLFALPDTVKVKECTDIDKVIEEKENITVLSYREVGKSVLLSIKTDKNQEPKNVVASYWLRKLITDNNLLAAGRKFIILSGIFKTTPTKTKARLYYT
jgi:hypothetical protein